MNATFDPVENRWNLPAFLLRLICVTFPVNINFPEPIAGRVVKSEHDQPQAMEVRGWFHRLARFPFWLGAVGGSTLAVLTMLEMARLFHQFDGWPGSAGFSRIAANLLNEALFSSNGVAPTAERMPLYPFLLAATMKLGGAGWRWWAVGLNGLALATYMGLATHLCARLHPGTGTTWACVLILSLHIALGIEALAFRETVWFTLVIVALASVLTVPRIGAKELLLSGALSGAAYLLRPTGFLVLVILPFWVWAARGLLTVSLGKALALSLSLAFLAVASWQTFVLCAVGHLQLSNNEGGNTVLKGAIPEFWEVVPWVDLDRLDPLVNDLAQRAGAGTQDERDRFSLAQAKGIVRAAPGNWCAKGLAKLAMLFSPVNVPFGYGNLVPRGNSVKLVNFRWDHWAFASVPCVLLLLVGSLCRLWEWKSLGAQERPFAISVALLLVLFCGIHAATSGETRYRLPFDPLLTVLAAPVIAETATRLIQRAR